MLFSQIFFLTYPPTIGLDVVIVVSSFIWQRQITKSLNIVSVVSSFIWQRKNTNRYMINCWECINTFYSLC